MESALNDESSGSLYRAFDQLNALLKSCVVMAFGAAASQDRGKEGAPWWDENCDAANTQFRQAHRENRLSDDTKRCKKHYNWVKKRARAAYNNKRVRGLLDMFFHEGRRFWQLLKGSGRREPCPIQDLAKWREHFESVFNSGVADGESLPLEPINQVFNKLHGCADWREGRVLKDRRESATGLNDDFSGAEVAGAISKSRNYSAAGPDGITPELLRYATMKDEDGVVINVLAEPLAALFNCMLQRGHYPHQFCQNSLSVIHKKGDTLQCTNYRGVMVGNVLAKVHASVVNERCSEWCEENGLRAESQAAFRKELGTLNQLLVMRQIKDKVRSDNSMVFACFLDIEKAFDTAKREALWVRLEERGVQGKIMDTIKSMFEKVCVRVKVDGKYSEPFRVLQGVKQGDPISPLLFGLLIEILHEMLIQSCQADGVVVGDKMITDLLFADDTTLLAGSADGLQRMLRVVELFCEVFGLRVNLSKSCVVVFRRSRRLPVAATRAVWLYKGVVLEVKDSVIYVGVELHAWKSFHLVESRLMLAASKARLALQNRVVSQNITVPELRVRLFNVLVTPVLSYGCQVWGVDYLNFNKLPALLNSQVERLQLSYLRFISGCGKSTLLWALLREFSCKPMVLHWLNMVLRFWNRIVGHDEWLAKNALKANLVLVRRGDVKCWSYGLLSCVRSLGLLPNDINLDDDSVFGLADHKFDIQGILKEVNVRIDTAIWLSTHENPRVCPSDGAVRCKYYRWFEHRIGQEGCKTYGRHVTCCAILPHKHMNLMRFRLGNWKLAVNTYHNVERSLRTCGICKKQGCVEDEYHVVFECAAYNQLRVQYYALFSHQTMADFFNQPNQTNISDFLFEVKRLRDAALE